MNNLIRMLLGLTCALTMAACDAVSFGLTPDFETKGEVRPAKEQAVENRAKPTGLILESFTCRERRGGGYHGTATFKNEGKTLTDVRMRLTALAGDKIELDYTTGVPQDIPNGSTVQLSAGTIRTDPSHIKYCGIEVKENRKKVLGGDLKDISFSSDLLTLPVSFVSRFAEKQTIAAPKPSVYEDDATKDDTGRTALRSGSVWNNKLTEYENNCDEVFLGQDLGLPNWEVRKAPNGIRYWSCEGPEGPQANDTVYFGALWEALEGQYGSIKCLGDMTIDWEVQKDSGEPQIESVSTVRCY